MMSGVACGEHDLYMTLSEGLGELHGGDGEDAVRH